MRRLYFLAVLAFALMPSIAHAQSNGWQTVTGPGYSYQVPSYWYAAPNPDHPESEIAVSGSDQSGVFVIVLPDSASGASLPTSTIQSINLQIASKDVLHSPPSGASNFSVVNDAAPTQVQGADSATRGTATYIDKNQVSTSRATIAAVVGRQMFVFDADLSSAFVAASTDASNYIVNSFQLTGSTVSAPPAANTIIAAPSGAILQASGSGDKSTQAFTVPASWSLQYTYDCTKYASFGGGTLGIFVYNPDGSFSLGNSPTDANPSGNVGGDTQFYHTGGTFYLDVVSDCNWQVTVTAP